MRYAARVDGNQADIDAAAARVGNELTSFLEKGSNYVADIT